jgi:serine/threonine protein kinase
VAVFPEAPVPRRIGDYQIVRRLRAEGPFETFLAQEHGPLGFVREVTLRCVRRDPDDPKHATELAREARICSRLNHPAVARVVGFFEDADRLVLVLEHIDGVTLASLLARVEERGERLPDPACAYIASTVASALAYAHSQLDENGEPTPVLHRALSPEVVHVMRDGTVKLGGFSLAKVLDRTPDSAVGLASAGYSAPERLRGGTATERSDVWALGALAFRLFGGAAAARSVMQVMAGRPPSLSSVREGVARELVGAIDAALQEDPRKRTITCSELARWIARVAPAEEGKKAIRDLMESVPEENAGEPAAPDRTARRKVRAMQRMAPSAKMAVLHGAREREEEEEELSIDSPIEAVEVQAKEAPAIARVPTPPPHVPTPAPRVPTPAPAVVEKAPEFDYPHIEVKGERRTDPGVRAARAATMLGLGPVVPKAGLVITEAAPPPPAIQDVPVPAAIAKPALAGSASRARLDPIVVAPAALPAPPAPPPVTALDETTELPRVKSRNLVPLVFAIVAIAMLIGAAGVVFAMRTKARAPVPVVTKELPPPPLPASAPVPVKLSATPSVTVSPKPAPVASPIATASASSHIAPPHGKKLPKDFGWLYVHAPDKINTRVFVAGRSRGTPGQVLMVPCGKLYVNLAKVDANGNWKGWAAKGVTSNIPCNGTVGEVTFTSTQ